MIYDDRKAVKNFIQAYKRAFGRYWALGIEPKRKKDLEKRMAAAMKGLEKLTVELNKP